MKRSIITLILLSIIIITLITSEKPISSVTDIKTDAVTTLKCCNIFDPRYNNDANFSWNCIENGIEIEIIINWQKCYCAWQSNNWQPPNGLQCNIIEQCPEKR